MPKTSCDYSRTVIYKIQHIDNDTLLYIGSTTEFTKRKCQHKRNCNNEKSKSYNLKVYKMIRDNGGWGEFEMIQIKEFPCENKRQAEMEEDIIMREMKASLNTIRAYLSPADKKQEKKVINKEYREANKEAINKKGKAYRQANIEAIKERKKAYCETNKEKMNMKYTCECGSTYRKDNRTSSKARHERSQKHIKFINNIIL